MTRSTEITWDVGGIAMFGTLVVPEGDGPFPAVVMVAGSGPTDRDWCSPLLAGTNGSARLLADAFAYAGLASLRYDKRASGPHARENLPKLMGHLSMASHLDELVGAVTALVDDQRIDRSRIVGLGNSEGTIHVLHYADSAQTVPFAGVILAAPPGRPVRDVLLAQLTAQTAALPDGASIMTRVREATDRYAAGEPMNPDPSVPEPIRAVLSSFEAPANLPFARELWTESAVDALAAVTVPVLVLIGGKDLQIDAHADGDPLQAAAAGRPSVTFAFPPDANHVLKQDLRPLAEIAASPGSGYNQDGTHLDPEAVRTIIDWLRATVG
ncbi:alpha/beta hydrolase family protein [Microbacterium gorillae]|uniref:alpha/beta hydrolase family protein n=1 Tax=Microbacterium gorillae TaxID=1231063 RepID=UPI00058D8A83|nr:alpha/beta fold hydrolase [Microbacterium gorillae]